eukprot:CAMPEP_0169470972 /NCGR_PEP_ID=MMETSP1042-20121227/24341_1 /TAXON_ID=464988 /ORGANISM="Hemiselmis andersenii, Strain CCMP1180" /LENGTH=51 /DNA_ID=CAMNT_0009584637 /DNA_START=15 /DNA_END=167 /DNA_ORIENTATION=-
MAAVSRYICSISFSLFGPNSTPLFEAEWLLTSVLPAFGRWCTEKDPSPFLS